MNAHSWLLGLCDGVVTLHLDLKLQPTYWSLPLNLQQNLLSLKYLSTATCQKGCLKHQVTFTLGPSWIHIPTAHINYITHSIPRGRRQIQLPEDQSQKETSCYYPKLQIFQALPRNCAGFQHIHKFSVQLEGWPEMLSGEHIFIEKPGDASAHMELIELMGQDYIRA